MSENKLDLKALEEKQDLLQTAMFWRFIGIVSLGFNLILGWMLIFRHH